MEKYREDWDGAWKHVLTHHLEELLDFAFPEIYRQIDWSCGYETLNTELLSSRGELSRRSHVDYLVRLIEKGDGEDRDLVLHVEQQGWKERGFSRRVFDYHIELKKRYGRVCTIVILADDNPDWHFDYWEEEYYGQRLSFSVPSLKVLDYREEELRQSSHPAAFLLLASQKALATRRGGNRFERRFRYKQEFTEFLLNKHYPQEQTTRLFQALDWLLALPAAKELQFHQWASRLFAKQPLHTMKLYTIERLVREEGLKQGLELGIEQGIEQGRKVGQVALLQRQLMQRFGLLPEWVREKLEAASIGELEAWSDRIFTANSLEELLKLN